jgi:hypothetical protein
MASRKERHCIKLKHDVRSVKKSRDWVSLVGHKTADQRSTDYVML